MKIVLFPLVWFYVVSYGIGHVWWMMRELVVDRVHFDKNEERRILRAETMKMFGVRKVDVVRGVLRLVLLPPWYYTTLAWINMHP